MENETDIAIARAEEDFSVKIGKIHEVYTTLNTIDIEGDESEAIDLDCFIGKPAIFGQMLMNQLSSPMDVDPLAFDMGEKRYWLEVANHLGPDWIGKLKRVVAFMDKAQAF